MPKRAMLLAPNMQASPIVYSEPMKKVKIAGAVYYTFSLFRSPYDDWEIGH